ncbi:hypothetical protein FXO38_12897 [Capsicum annuum]|nr:hypothetical protein FXO38_12897 [Capsicum annuum]
MSFDQSKLQLHGVLAADKGFGASPVMTTVGSWLLLVSFLVGRQRVEQRCLGHLTGAGEEFPLATEVGGANGGRRSSDGGDISVHRSELVAEEIGCTGYGHCFDGRVAPVAGASTMVLWVGEKGMNMICNNDMRKGVKMKCCVGSTIGLLYVKLDWLLGLSVQRWINCWASQCDIGLAIGPLGAALDQLLGFSM